MNIILAIKSLNVPGGGAERVLVEVAEGLFRRGHAVRVMTFDFPGESFYDLSPDIERCDLAFNLAGQSIPRLKMLWALPKMRAAIARGEPDVIVAFMHSTYVPVAIAALGLGVPLVVSEHTEARHYHNRPLQRGVRQLVDRYAALRTVPSESVRAGYDRLFDRPAVVVQNPVNLQLFEACSALTPDESPVILSVGRLMIEKDHAVLLDAFAYLADSFPEWRLRIVGEGPLRADLERQAIRLGISDRIEMPGFVRDVGSEYAKARFVVLSSRYESFGMVAAEALAAGRAVLSFDDCAGIAELVDNGINGILVTGKPSRGARTEAITDGMRRLMRDPALCIRLGNAGPSSVARYGLDSALDRWEEVLHQAVSQPL